MFVTLKRTRRSAFLLVSLGLWSWSGVASADDQTAAPASPSSTAEEAPPRDADSTPPGSKPTLGQARTAFLEGRSLVADGKWADAEKQFRVAARVKDTPGLRYYIGFCQEKQGLLVEAMGTYREAEELLSVQQAPDVEKLVPEAIQRVSGLLSLLLLFDVPPGAVLTVDGKERPLSQQFYVNPGSHRLVLQKDGYEDFVHEFSLRAGERGRLQVKMKEIPEAPAQEELGQDEGARSDPLQRAVFWSSSGVGVVGLGLGVTGAVLLGSTKREVNELNEIADDLSGGDDAACADPSSEMVTVCSDLERGGKRKNAAGHLMVGGFIAAGVGAAGAVISHFFWPEARVRVDVGLGPGATTLGLRGRF